MNPRRKKHHKKHHKKHKKQKKHSKHRKHRKHHKHFMPAAEPGAASSAAVLPETIASTAPSEGADVVGRIRDWLNAWRPDGADGISIRARRTDATQRADLVGREAYEIEIVEKKAPHGRKEDVEAVRDTGLAPNLPAFVSEIANMTKGNYPTRTRDFEFIDFNLLALNWWKNVG